MPNLIATTSHGCHPPNPDSLRPKRSKSQRKYRMQGSLTNRQIHKHGQHTDQQQLIHTCDHTTTSANSCSITTTLDRPTGQPSNRPTNRPHSNDRPKQPSRTYPRCFRYYWGGFQTTGFDQGLCATTREVHKWNKREHITSDTLTHSLSLR